MCFYIIHSLNIQQFERSGKSETRGQVFSLRANSHVQDILARFLRLACTHPHLHMVTPSVSCVNVGVCPNPKSIQARLTSHGQTAGFDFSWDALGTKDINSLVYPPLVTSKRLIPTSVTQLGLNSVRYGNTVPRAPFWELRSSGTVTPSSNVLSGRNFSLPKSDTKKSKNDPFTLNIHIPQ